jgi:hypothetical protein
LKACEEGMCETLANLRKCHERPGGLGDGGLDLPNMIASLAGDALAANPVGANEEATEENTSQIQKAQLPTVDTAPPYSPGELGLFLRPGE